jgi:hypothetical protein
LLVKKWFLVGLCTFLFAFEGAAEFDNCHTTIAVAESVGQLISISQCSWRTFGQINQAVRMTGDHSFASMRTVCGGAGYCGTSLTESPYNASTTYTSTVRFTAAQLSVFAETSASASITTAPPIRPRTDIPRNTINCPLVLDLNGDGIHTTGLDRAVSFFDTDDDLFGNPSGWLLETSEDAFLWMDGDANNVASGHELFGSHMYLPTGEYAQNGFQALEIYDEFDLGGNKDGEITKDDRIWNRLRLWVDRDHDGFSDLGEIETLGHRKIESLSLAREHTHILLPDGNGVMLVGNYSRRVVRHGDKNEVETFRMDDILFVRQ